MVFLYNQGLLIELYFVPLSGILLQFTVVRDHGSECEERERERNDTRGYTCVKEADVRRVD